MKTEEKIKKETKGFIKEFKEFISRGNVIDMAVGVIIGGAFTTIVSSLVEDIFMPLLGIISGGIDLTGLSISVNGAVLKYGIFLQNVIDFIIIAFCMFVVVRAINKMHNNLHKDEAETEKNDSDNADETAQESDEVKLLKEIRDLLAKK